MKDSRFYIVDVFGQNKFSGNQLAVFTNGEVFSDEEMQTLTNEINFSESTFIFPEESKDNTFKVRIFMPGSEIPFAGHPTLGTAYVIQKFLLNKKYDTINLDLKAGIIPIKIDYRDNEPDLLTMKQNQPAFGRTIQPDKVKRVINTDKIDTNFPIQNISTGMQHTIIPLKGLEAIKEVAINQEELISFLSFTGSTGLFLFTAETYEEKNDLNARMFFYVNRVVEDPVTGSANGCLIAYLLKHNYFSSSRIDIRVEQGFEIGRNGILYLKGEKKESSYDIFVGGRIFPVAECRMV